MNTYQQVLEHPDIQIALAAWYDMQYAMQESGEIAMPYNPKRGKFLLFELLFRLFGSVPTMRIPAAPPIQRYRQKSGY